MYKHLLIVLALVFICCGPQKREDTPSGRYSGNKKDFVVQSYDDSLLQSKTAEAVAERERETAEEEVSDSMRLEKLQKIVIEVIKQNLHKKAFKGKIEDSNYNYRRDYAFFQYGNIFSNHSKHLLVKKFLDQGIWSDLITDAYLVTNSKLKIVFSDTAFGYSGDTLTDINGDGYKDYVVSIYSGAGCCPRDAQTGYIYNPVNGIFMTTDFFNPEFDLKKKLVYEMSYGRPGDVQFEKYKWNGREKVLTEVIAPTLKDGKLNSFIKPYTFTRISYPGEKVTILKTLPEEYKRLQNYEYFTGYQ